MPYFNHFTKVLTRESFRLYGSFIHSSGVKPESKIYFGLIETFRDMWIQKPAYYHKMQVAMTRGFHLLKQNQMQHADMEPALCEERP